MSNLFQDLRYAARMLVKAPGRTHELGIRMALGAQQADVLKLVLGRSMLWTLGGVAAGILGAIGLRRAMKVDPMVALRYE